MERKHQASNISTKEVSLPPSKTNQSSIRSATDRVEAPIMRSSKDIELLLSINGQSFSGLVDSGARISIIDSKHLNRLPEELLNTQKQLPQPLIIRFASSHSPKGRVTHTITLPIAINGLQFTWTFHIMPASNEIILGLQGNFFSCPPATDQ